MASRTVGSSFFYTQTVEISSVKLKIEKVDLVRDGAKHSPQGGKNRKLTLQHKSFQRKL